MIMNTLGPNQKQMVSQFQSKNREEQANEIVNICNRLNISKEDFIRLYNMMNKIR